MTTEQSYVGGGNNAPSSPQTAQNEAKQTTAADNRQLSPDDRKKEILRYRDPLKAHTTDLLTLISEVTCEISLSVYVEQITKNSFNALREAIGANDDAPYDKTRSYEVHEYDLDELYTSLRLIVCITRIYEKQFIIDELSKGGDSK